MHSAQSNQAHITLKYLRPALMKGAIMEEQKTLALEPGGRGYCALCIKHRCPGDKASAEEKTLCHLLGCENLTLLGGS